MLAASTRPDSRAFRELLDVMQAYERKFLRKRFLWGDNEYADGYRSLLDLLSTGLDCFVHNSPERPHFISLVSPLRKIGGDNADALYPFAPLAPGRRYRVTGSLGSAIYVGCIIYGGDDNEKFHLVSGLSTPDLKVDEHGRFEFTITPSPELEGRGPHTAPGATMRTDNTARCLVIRRYYLDKQGMADNPGIESIEPLDPVPTPGLLSGREMERQLKALSSFLRGWLNLTPIPMPPVPFAYNRFSRPRPASADTGHWSTPDNHHSFGLFRLREDQGLFVRGRAPKCTYWSVHLWNPYLQTLDYEHHPVAMNCSEVELEEDGSFELCIAHRDPGHRNWISTSGKKRGMVYFRFLQSASQPEALQADTRSL